MMDLTCDMHRECEQTVTHIDEKGFLYCTDHGRARQSSHRCRKLLPSELRRLKRGEQLTYY